MVAAHHHALFIADNESPGRCRSSDKFLFLLRTTSHKDPRVEDDSLVNDSVLVATTVDQGLITRCSSRRVHNGSREVFVTGLLLLSSFTFNLYKLQLWTKVKVSGCKELLRSIS